MTEVQQTRYRGQLQGDGPKLLPSKALKQCFFFDKSRKKNENENTTEQNIYTTRSNMKKTQSEPRRTQPDLNKMSPRCPQNVVSSRFADLDV